MTMDEIDEHTMESSMLKQVLGGQKEFELVWEAEEMADTRGDYGHADPNAIFKFMWNFFSAIKTTTGEAPTH